MRKELTRTKQALSNESIQRIIDTTAYGVLSLNGDDGYLYTVPLSYVYTGGAVYFHGSPRVLPENQQNKLFDRRAKSSRSDCPSE